MSEIKSSADSGSDRLGFAAAVLDAFAFLLPMGFEVVRRDGTFVRYESSTVLVNVYHGRSSYQVGLELGRLREGSLYSLYEVLSAVAPADVERARCQTTDPVVLKRCVVAIAETVQRNCEELLAGAPAAFEGLDSVVVPRRDAATTQAEYGAIISKADSAWEAKDFRQAADLYEKALSGLDETRTRRLEYLRQRGAKDSNA